MSSYPKGKSDNKYRASQRKRKFRGNQYTTEKGESKGQNAIDRKLSAASSDDVPVDLSHRYRIIEFATVFTLLSELLCCKVCKGTVKFEESGQRGFGWNLVVSCKCGGTSVKSGPFIGNVVEINRRMVFVMRLLGIGLKGINLFSSLMDFGEGISKKSYDSILEHISQASKMCFQKSCENTVHEQEEEKEKRMKPHVQPKISGDVLDEVLNGNTQNAKKSFITVIERLAPKHLNCCTKTVEIATYIAATVFNTGFTSILKMMKCLEFSIGFSASDYAKKINEERTKRQDTRDESSESAAMDTEHFEELLFYGSDVAD